MGDTPTTEDNEFDHSSGDEIGFDEFQHLIMLTQMLPTQ